MDYKCFKFSGNKNRIRSYTSVMIMFSAIPTNVVRRRGGTRHSVGELFPGHREEGVANLWVSHSRGSYSVRLDGGVTGALDLESVDWRTFPYTGY